MRVAYFVHELADAAVTKRRAMLEAAGCAVALLGFERDRGSPAPAPRDALVFGRTRNGRFAARALSVLAAVPKALRARGKWRGADLILARNLEMLALVVALVRLTGSRAAIAYECLDVHRLALAPSLVGRMVRAVERFCLKRTSAVITSSPAFESNYFRPRQGAERVLIAENKVLELEPPAPPLQPPPAPPWTIAWCGVLRCRRSFELLRQAVLDAKGELRVELWGRPALDQIPDFHAQIASAAPDLTYCGPYESRDLARIYARAHFAWAVDFYEAGGNSDWLLPNRLYESLCWGATPIAGAGVETARWLERNRVGVVLAAPIERSLADFVAELTPERCLEHRAAALALPRSAICGGYDKSFSHNEDAEFDLRFRASGRRILLAGDIVVDYFPRPGAAALARQYFKHGRGRARTMRKHGQRPKLRQLAPAMVAPALLMSALTPLTPWAALPGLAWLTASLGYGALLGMRAGSSCAFGSGLAAALMHVGWSAGFWRQTFSPTPKPAEGSLAAE